MRGSIRKNNGWCTSIVARVGINNNIVCKHHALTVPRVKRQISALADTLRPIPKFTVSGWVRVYNSASTMHQGVEANTGAKVLKTKLAFNWTNPYTLLAAGPSSVANTPDDSPLGDNLLYSDFPFDLPGSDARRRATIERCNDPCANPHESSDMPRHLPAGLTQYVLNSVSKISPPCHVTQDDVAAPLQRLEVEKITGYQSVRGRGGIIAVLYKTHCVGLSEASWE